MKQWLERHAQTLVGSLGRLWTQPFATLLTVLVIGIGGARKALEMLQDRIAADLRSARGILEGQEALFE